ncbi:MULTISPECIES: glycerol kinase GlpK [Anaerofustis]|uniref:glycerol kinase GlpK n=1 Tax=Anaerofustis TaxID=264995 RepID=UPI001106E1AA|nr:MULTISPECIES: glycerol kinase GlpK [Anaerofustis]MCO8193413.1 glycerol kinase GlpK [Anaerofustis sp. NSJ-163]
MKKYILAIDQGTTSCRTILFDENADIVSVEQREFKQIYPKAGYVEHDAMEIWMTQLFTIKQCVQKANINIDDIKGVGITNQRETTVLWDKDTGYPIYNAIVWQCRRTADICEDLREKGLEQHIINTTGLKIDAYFSATKIKWILDNVEGARKKAEEGKILFGTIDTWLIYNLTKGKVHATDYTNASRTMLYDIHNLKWDEKIMEALDIPKNILPEVVNSSGIIGYMDKEILGKEIPIAGVAGDQQSALFGQGCYNIGEAKNTYGTGLFLLMNTGEEPIKSHNGLLTTIAYGIDGKITYALEGSVFIGGAVVQWLRDELGMIQTAAETYQIATSVNDTNGVYIVPAFTGLGAPYWDMYAKGIITGITRGAKKAHIVRAALESICYQTKDLLDAIEDDSKIPLKELMVDGGACQNDFIMQFQSDILNCPVNKPNCIESTAMGAAFLAGLATGVWNSEKELKEVRKTSKLFNSEITEEKRKELYAGWKHSVKMCLTKKDEI